jgi:hypothetical protein
MAQSSSKANSYVQSATGLWTPVGYGPTNLPAPAAVSSPNAMANSAAMSIAAYLQPYGSLRVTNDPASLFYDSFDSIYTLDTTTRWSTAGTIVPTQQGGYLAVNPGTAASASGRITSRPLFAPPGQGFVVFATEVGLEATPLANIYRFWGWASEPATPAYQGAAATTSLALYDAIGFETDTAGSLYAVVYNSGTLSYRSAALTRPNDGAVHRYMIMRRHDLIYWYLDNTEYPVAGRDRTTVSAQNMPVKLAAYNGTTALTGSPSFNVVTVTVAETTGASNQISDGTYPWRKAQVTPSSHLKAQVYSSSVGNSSPAMTTAAATVLAANTSRVGATIFNDAASASAVYVALGITATATAFTVLIAVGGYYELPYGFTGAVTGICASGTATLRVNELT